MITIDGGYLDIGIKDTMIDLFVNFIGAYSFSIIGWLYIKNRDKYKFAENFMPIRKTEEEIQATKAELERLEHILEQKKARTKKILQNKLQIDIDKNKKIENENENNDLK